MAPMAQAVAVLVLMSYAAMTGQNQDVKPADDAFTCHSDHFSCYKDCCRRGEMFCHHRFRKCYYCDTRKVLCGNDSLPVECLLYCHLLQHPPNTGTENRISFDRVTFIAATAAIFILIGIAVVGICYLVWKRARDKERLRHPDGQKDTDDGETNTHELHESGNPKKPLLCGRSSKSGSLTTSLASSDNSRTSLDVGEFNISTVDTDIDNKTQPASPFEDGPDGSEARRGARGLSSAGQGTRDQTGQSTSDASTPTSPAKQPSIVADVAVSRPDFSSIAPTNDPTNRSEKVVIATGTQNPAENCCTESAQRRSDP